jgi:hypothetical protein
MKIWLALALSFFVALIPAAWAETASLRTECSTNNIVSLHTSKIDKLSALGDLDLCRPTSPAIPQIVTDVLNTVGDVQNKVAQVFKMRREDLFFKGIDLSLSSWDLGPLDEGASGNSVTISFFKDWSGEPIDQAGLAHELGHVIAGTTADNTSIRDLRGTSLFSEGFSDLVAYATFGRVFDRLNDLPATLNHFFTRDLSSPVTFKQPLNIFLETYANDEGTKLCTTLPAEEQKLPHVASVCSFLKNPEVEPIADYYKTLARAPEPFSAQACLQMWEPTWEGPGCDVHQVSLPFTSFLVALDKTRQGPDIAGLLRLLVRPSSSADGLPKHLYSCYYRSEAGKAHPIQVGVVHFDDLTRILKAQSDSNTWNKLWDQLGLDAGTQMQAADTLSVAWHFAFYRMKDFYDHGGSSFYSAANPCAPFDTVGLVSPPEACKISCDLLTE